MHASCEQAPTRRTEPYILVYNGMGLMMMMYNIHIRVNCFGTVGFITISIKHH
jgi:hypothetical protein